MSEITPTSESDADHAALAALITDDLLRELEARLAEFNIFEPILGRWEIRHSDWLAFLLDPQRSHGLGDTFLRAVLQHISAVDNSSVAARAASYATGEINHVSVYRERHYIDILVLLQTGAKKLAVIIENKIGADEGPDQLERYRRVVQERYHSDVVGM